MASRKDKKPEKPKYQSLNIDHVKYKTLHSEKFRNRKNYEPSDPRVVTAFIPGTIKNIFVKMGDEVKKGDKLLVLEAMKMKNILISPINGIVKSINVVSKDIVAKNQELINLDYSGDQSD